MPVIALLCVGTLVILGATLGTTWAAATGRLRLNAFAGIRIRSTMSGPDAWHRAALPTQKVGGPIILAVRAALAPDEPPAYRRATTTTKAETPGHQLAHPNSGWRRPPGVAPGNRPWGGAGGRGLPTSHGWWCPFGSTWSGVGLDIHRR